MVGRQRHDEGVAYGVRQSGSRQHNERGGGQRKATDGRRQEEKIRDNNSLPKN
jgi:hypothetical protein